MSVCKKTASYDVVVVGGGFAGVCAAIAAARGGASVAIIQNRSVFGGTGSSEIRMHIVGANCHSSKPNMRETGILEEILLENKRRNPYADFPIFDMIIWEKVKEQQGLVSYLNTNVDDVITDGSKICAVIAHQNSTETEFTISGKIFVDATGHGTLGVMAGAISRVGSEGRDEFGEPTAPEKPNNNKMGCMIMFHAVDRGEPVEFIRPRWANVYTENDLRYRPHVDAIGAQKDGGGIVAPTEGKNQLPEFSNVDAGYWWIEMGGDWEDEIADGEELKDELLKCVYGVWDHIKNGGKHGAENYDLDWVGMVMGYRESRRLDGDYILNENDVRANRVFDDAVAYGAWPMDVHVPGGICELSNVPSRVYNFEGCYTIPYRCYCSKNIENLMMAGRDISTSKMAFSSSRVMGTCAVGGQAVGTAAALAIRHGCTVKEIGAKHIRELQQKLLKDDCFIPGYKNEDENDWAKYCTITATSETPNGKAINVINGVSRSVADETNYWQSESLSEPQSITLKLNRPVRLNELRLTFDTDLSHEIQPSMIRNVLNREVKGLPHELVKDYTVILTKKGERTKILKVKGNSQRLNVLPLDGEQCDEVTVSVEATHGCDFARIFEIRLY